MQLQLAVPLDWAAGLSLRAGPESRFADLRRRRQASGPFGRRKRRHPFRRRRPDAAGRRRHPGAADEV